MAKLGKRLTALRAKIDRNKLYPATEALSLVKETATAKFDESIDVAVQLGIDPIHFGILIIVNMEIGMCHPPVGLNLYVASGITRMGISELTVAVLPWLMTMLGFLALVTYVPQISLWLPKLIYG